MPVPKRHKSKSKTRMQRAANMKFTPVAHSKCDSCGEPKLAHMLCPSCGKYDGKQIIEIKADA